MDNSIEYKVFISYAWTTPEHEEWVNNLANRLMADGIEVKYDKWDLKAGHDKYSFMESMVKDNTINNVLIICDKGYKNKADERAGGVGTETQIITPELYNNTDQEKFIPIIAQIGENFDSYMPLYLKSRIGINLSSDEVFEEGYEKLLRTITQRPLYRKPTKGNLPSFLFDDKKSNFKTNNLNKQIKNCIFKNSNQAKSLIYDFIIKNINEIIER